MYPSAQPQQQPSLYPGQQLPTYQNNPPVQQVQVAVTYPMQPGGVEDLTNPRYRCLCQKMHVVLGAKVIGILELVSIALNFFSVMEKKNAMASAFSGWLLSAAITGLIVGLMFLGIQRQRKSYVLPHLVFQAIGIAVLAIGGLVFLGLAIIGLVVAKTEASTETEGIVFATIFMIFIGLLLIVVAGLEIWFFFVILRLYEYLGNRESAPVAQPIFSAAGGGSTPQYPTAAVDKAHHDKP